MEGGWGTGGIGLVNYFYEAVLLYMKNHSATNLEIALKNLVQFAILVIALKL